MDRIKLIGHFYLKSASSSSTTENTYRFNGDQKRRFEQFPFRLIDSIYMFAHSRLDFICFWPCQIANKSLPSMQRNKRGNWLGNDGEMFGLKIKNKKIDWTPRRRSSRAMMKCYCIIGRSADVGVQLNPFRRHRRVRTARVRARIVKWLL